MRASRANGRKAMSLTTGTFTTMHGLATIVLLPATKGMPCSYSPGAHAGDVVGGISAQMTERAGVGGEAPREHAT